MTEQEKTVTIVKAKDNWTTIALVVAVALLVWLATVYWFQFSAAARINGNGFMAPMMGGLSLTSNQPAVGGSSGTANPQYQKLHEQCEKLMDKNGIDMNKMHQQMHGNNSSFGPGMMGSGMMGNL